MAISVAAGRGGRCWARWWALASVVAGLALCEGSSMAGPAGPPGAGGPVPKTDKASHDKAQKAYEEALKLYKGGQYRAAIDKLIEARKLDPTAKELPYNLGMVHEKLGNLDDAIKNFELYLTLETDDAEKERVRSIIKRLEGARAELKGVPTASASAPPPPPPATSSAPPPEPTETAPIETARRRGRLDGLVYGTGGLAAAAAAAGVFFGVRALVLRPGDTTGANKSIEALQSDSQKAHQSAVIADISFGVALVSGGAAALLYLLREAPEQPPTSSAVLAPVRGGVVAGWVGRFLAKGRVGSGAAEESGASLGR